MKRNHQAANLQSQKLTDGRYVYYPAKGAPIYITPGKDAPEEVIIMLDNMDHDEALQEHYAEKNRDYRIQHMQKRVSDSNDCMDEDPLEALPDPRADVFSTIFPEESCSEQRIALANAMTRLTPQQIDLIYDRFGLFMSEVDIAKRDGVTKQAVFNRQKKLLNRIKKLLEKSQKYDSTCFKEGG